MGRQHIDSWYAASAPARAARQVLKGAIDADVCVIGGGIAGCSTALHLAERGRSVALLEAELVGWGASGRSGAQAITGVACVAMMRDASGTSRSKDWHCSDN